MLVGIDLGTTFSCVSYIDPHGRPVMVPSAEGETNIPSVVWFDGRRACVGRRAVRRKGIVGPHIREFFKRDLGKPLSVSGGGEGGAACAPYEIGGYRFGAAGIAAILLRQIREDCLRYLKEAKLIPPGTDTLEAVLTVPAYFGDAERLDVKLAGHAAGLQVVAIINEPTAAALAYNLFDRRPQRIMVFDLGGGTFDVTILRLQEGRARVETSRGDKSLGGKDWDALIEEYLYSEFLRTQGRPIPDDRGFDVQAAALRAKFDLTEKAETEVHLDFPEGCCEIRLSREGSEDPLTTVPVDGSMASAFYFESRALGLCSRCRALVDSAMESVTVPLAGGERTRRLDWTDINEIILAGGSCRMPMIPKMIEAMSGKKVRRTVDDLGYDTAIAIGAAIFGGQRDVVQDVLSHSVGVHATIGGRSYADRILPKDSPLPVRAERVYHAPEGAALLIYEGESDRPDECTIRGWVELDNPVGPLIVRLGADAMGILSAEAGSPPRPFQALRIRNPWEQVRDRAEELQRKVDEIVLESE